MTRNPILLWSKEFYRAVEPRIVSAGFHHARPNWAGRPMRALQTHFNIWYVANGAGAVRISDKWVTFQAGDLIIIKPGQYYQEERSTPESHFDVYYVHVLPFWGEHDYLNTTLARCWPTKVAAEGYGDMESLFYRLSETYTMGAEGFSLQVKSAMLEIFHLMFTGLRHRTEVKLPCGYAKLFKARSYIEQHHADALTLEEIAIYSDLSESYLLALFKKFFKTTPIDYQIDCRIRSAKLLLAQGESVTRTAESMGFGSLHYFSRTFKKRCGLTPSQYAQQIP